MITVLIPFSNTSQNSYRLRNIRAVVDNFRKHYPEFNVLIAEQNAKGACGDLIGGNVSHVNVTIAHDGFNKCKLINTAIRENIKGGSVMMCDADCILPTLPMSVFEDGLSRGSVFFPFTEVNFLNEAHTRSYIRTGSFVQSQVQQDLFINRYTGLINVFSLETFDQVGGFDPEFVNWGGEDDAFIEKCKRLIGPISRPLDRTSILHLYHSKADSDEYRKTECFTWNKKRVATIKRMSDAELRKYVSDMKAGIPDALDIKVREYDASGKLTFQSIVKIGDGDIKFDTTVYNISTPNGDIGLKDILQCVLDVDGAFYLSTVIGWIDERIKQISAEDIEIIEYYRSEVRKLTG